MYLLRSIFIKNIFQSCQHYHFKKFLIITINQKGNFNKKTIWACARAAAHLSLFPLELLLLLFYCNKNYFLKRFPYFCIELIILFSFVWSSQYYFVVLLFLLAGNKEIFHLSMYGTWMLPFLIIKTTNVKG